MKTLRFGVVGLGHRGRAMFELGATSFEGVVPVAACDLESALWFESQRNAVPMAEKFPQTKFYPDFQQMLDKAQLDVLLVETPAKNHAAFCAEGLRRNIHVLSDIPLVSSYDEAEMLWEAGKKSGALFMTGANPNEWGFVEEMARLHREGYLGDPVYMEAEYIHDLRCLWEETPWRRTLEPIRYCTHSLGPLLRLLPDRDLKEVCCMSTGAKTVGGDGEQDVMSALFKTDDNVVIRFMATFINEAKFTGHSYRVFGTGGYFERLSARGGKPAYTMFSSRKNDDPEKMIELSAGEKRTDLAEKTENAGHGGADYAIFYDFFNALQKGDLSRVITMKDGLRMTLPGIFAAESAAKGGIPVPIRYPWDA